jgi:hypothetical protein
VSETWDDPEDPDDEPDPSEIETVNLADPKSVRRARNRQRREIQENEALWRAILDQKAGRREIWRLLVLEGRALNTEFAAGPVGFPDPNATFYSLGRQQFALKLYHELLRIDPEGIRRMHEELDPRFVAPKKQREPRPE